MNFETLYRLTSKKPKDKAENGNILGIKSRKNLRRFSFVVRCLESYSNPKGHIASVIFPDVTFKLIDQNWHVPVKEEVLLKCSCPAFLYYGSAFYASQFGYHIDGNVENRPPVIRDPDSNRYLCKHLIRVYKYLDKTSFEKLLQRFKLASTQLKMASVEEDIAPAIADYLSRVGVSEEEIKDIISSLSLNNCEEVLEKYGVIISELPSAYDKIDIHPVDSIITKEILRV
ncbi:MAG: SWIM zinc finger family protein [Candidatus Pacearchaeota archaeon]